MFNKKNVVLGFTLLLVACLSGCGAASAVGKAAARNGGKAAVRGVGKTAVRNGAQVITLGNFEIAGESAASYFSRNGSSLLESVDSQLSDVGISRSAHAGRKKIDVPDVVWTDFSKGGKRVVVTEDPLQDENFLLVATVTSGGATVGYVYLEVGDD